MNPNYYLSIIFTAQQFGKWFSLDAVLYNKITETLIVSFEWQKNGRNLTIKKLEIVIFGRTKETALDKAWQMKAKARRVFLASYQRIALNSSFVYSFVKSSAHKLYKYIKNLPSLEIYRLSMKSI